MQYGRLGSTGLEIARLCVGCMSFGESGRGEHDWTLDEDSSRVIIRRALEAGLNFFDTANMYSDGTSEEFLGRALKDFARREEVVIATKVGIRMRPGPNGSGLSRRHIFEQINASLKRLGTDHVDLYQIHRWDPDTPIEETLEALNDVVRMGKARYIGASSMYAWQFAKALFTQQKHGWAPFVSMQNHFNLLYREEEREMLPLCRDQKIGLLPWSPLARGKLARPHGQSTGRAQTDVVTARLYAHETAADLAVIDAVGAIAGRYGVSRAEVALAWVRQTDPVSAPIIGVTSAAQLDTAVSSLDLQLSADDMSALEADYRVKPFLL
ncbi:aldo/keto reductase [Pelagibacterium limicola]|uniref:aldo/keto reductase n=1 Tax=Pelagibacterium limicola TaxID=2791022 RepID=UPI0018AFBA3C|nr:aldo/keto reductase [Pelagibacterium limicola]